VWARRALQRHGAFRYSLPLEVWAVASELQALIRGWRIDAEDDVGPQIESMLESLFGAGLLRASANSVLLGEQYHLGGEEDTRRMAEMAAVGASDRVVDLACYVGGPARQLAREFGCRVLGVDMLSVHIAVAQRLTDLCGLGGQVEFVCADAESVPERDGSFTVAWSQGSVPRDLGWLAEMDRLLAAGGRLAFTGLIRRAGSSDQALMSLEEMADRVSGLGYRVVCAEDISEMDLAYGWLPEVRKLQDNEGHYRRLLGDDWVSRAQEEMQRDIQQWESGEMGNGRIVAIKG
jgi:SAM-dependent methyltransferase